MFTGVAIAAGFYIVAAHIVPAATDVGIAPTAAALIITVSGIAGIPGTVGGTWWLTEKLGHRRALLVLCAGQAVVFFLFILTSSLWAFYVVAALLGFCFSASTPVRQAMAPPLFGLKSIGAVLGFAYLAWSVGAVVGPFLAGLIYDLTGSYDLAFRAGRRAPAGRSGERLRLGQAQIDMRPEGVEPSTLGLRVPYSTIEPQARVRESYTTTRTQGSASCSGGCPTDRK